MNKNESNKNIIYAVVISLAFLILWQYFYEAPRQQKLENTNQANTYNKSDNQKKQVEKTEAKNSISIKSASNDEVVLTSKQRIPFENNKIKGTINPVGLTIDNLELKQYKDGDSNISLLQPSFAKEPYFVQFGFTSNGAIEMPNSSSVWSLQNLENNNFILTWKNSQNIIFKVSLKLDENYMFDINQEVVNNSQQTLSVAPFTRIVRSEPQKGDVAIISHEGFVVNSGETFNEISYDKVGDKGRIEYTKQKNLFWGGFTDKYWLTSFLYNNNVCISGNCSFIASDISLNAIKNGNAQTFQIDFVTDTQNLESGENLTMPSKLFAGAKELKLLDGYAKTGFNFNDKTYKFDNFDKTVDFGIFYFLTKPIFLFLAFLNSFLHNFGLAIILLTIIIKLALYPIATKSYISMGKMKAVAPEINKLRESITDKMELNRKIVELYKEKKINPLSGCLPIILQIPVFFALYKVLYISIEMRGAPFIWWIQDLSAKDPTSIFNLFGLLQINLPSFLQIGVLPILLGLTTYLQQLLSPKSNDPTQNMIIKTMPLILVFIFAGFPSGIVLYWIVNNLFSILQQLYIEKIVLPKQLNKSHKKS
jgi:YidC/Oxa1 family membrane protein insertase